MSSNTEGRRSAPDGGHLKAATRLPVLIAAQIQLLMGSMTGILNSVVATSSAPNPVAGVWNALVSNRHCADFRSADRCHQVFAGCREHGHCL